MLFTMVGFVCSLALSALLSAYSRSNPRMEARLRGSRALRRALRALLLLPLVAPAAIPLYSLAKGYPLASSPGRVTLYGSPELAAVRDVCARLQALAIEHSVLDDSASVLVTRSDRARAALALARAPLPPGGTLVPGPGDVQAALEAALDGQDGPGGVALQLVRDDAGDPVAATVVSDPSPAHELTSQARDEVTNLICAAVPGLAREQVRILTHAEAVGPEGAAILGARWTERDVEQRVARALRDTLGQQRFLVHVQATGDARDARAWVAGGRHVAVLVVLDTTAVTAGAPSVRPSGAHDWTALCRSAASVGLGSVDSVAVLAVAFDPAGPLARARAVGDELKRQQITDAAVAAARLLGVVTAVAATVFLQTVLHRVIVTGR